MPTLNKILKEIKDVPRDRLEELYEFIHKLKPSEKKTGNKEKILSFGGMFSEMTESNSKQH